MKEVVYLAVSADELELPVKIALNLDELAKWADKKHVEQLIESINTHSVDTKNRCKYFKVEISITKHREKNKNP